MARRLQKTASDNDDTNTESQQMIAVAHLLKQPKSDDKEMHQLRAKIQADQRVLRTLLDQRMRQAENVSKERREEITSSVYNALGGSSSQPTDREKTTMAGTKIAGNTTYLSIKDVLAQSEGLIKEYERLDGIIAAMRSQQTGSVAATWKHDIQETEEQLRKGARVAVRNVKQVLGADVGSRGEVEAQSGQDDELNYELQTSLRYAERGMKRMAKALPHEKA